MADLDAHRQRLLDLMEERRLQLGLKWDEVTENGGPSYETIRRIRAGQADIRPLTKRGIEIGMDWERGSVDKILTGGLPAPAVRRDAPPPAQTIDELVEKIQSMGEIPEGRRQEIVDEIRRAEAELDLRRKLAQDELRRWRTRSA